MVGEEQTIYRSLGGNASGTPIPSTMLTNELDSAISDACVRTDMDRLVASAVEASVGFDKSSSHYIYLEKVEKIVAPALAQLDHRIFSKEKHLLGDRCFRFGLFYNATLFLFPNTKVRQTAIICNKMQWV